MLARVAAPARRAHHPPGHADLRHAARSATARCSSRRRSTPSTRGAPAKIINSHPGVSPQLPAQPRLQHVVHARRRGGLALGLRGHARRAAGAHRRRVDPPAADAEAVQDPHGPRDGGRHRRRSPSAGVAEAPIELEHAALRRARHGRHPRHAGRPAGRARAVRAGRRRSSGMRVDALLDHLAGMASAGCCAASPRSSSTAAPASAPTAWASGRCPTTGSPRSARGWPPSAGSRTATSARPTPTGRTRSSRWPTAARRRSATRSSTRSPSEIRRSRTARRSTRSTEFKKIRLLYFTDDFKSVGSGRRR